MNNKQIAKELLRLATLLTAMPLTPEKVVDVVYDQFGGGNMSGSKLSAKQLIKKWTARIVPANPRREDDEDSLMIKDPKLPSAAEIGEAECQAKFGISLEQLSKQLRTWGVRVS